MGEPLLRLFEQIDASMVVIFFGVLGTLLLVLFGLGAFDGNEQRMQQRVARIREPKAAKTADEPQQLESLRRKRSDSKFATVDSILRRVLPNVGLLRARLERSGWELKVNDYVLVCAALWLGATLVFEFLVGLPFLISLIVGFLAGLGVPHLVLQSRITRRSRKFTTLLPDALDLIVRGIRSGLPVSEAIRAIGTDIEDPLGSEFRMIADQMHIGVPMQEAMWARAKRLQIPEFNFLVISMSIQQETGGNLSEILEKLADMVRRREQMRLKVKAMSSEARASAGIIGSLPFIMCALLGFLNPDYMSLLFTDPRGWIMIGIGFTSLAIGIGVMVKMVRFEI